MTFYSSALCVVAVAVPPSVLCVARLLPVFDALVPLADPLVPEVLEPFSLLLELEEPELLVPLLPLVFDEVSLPL